LRLNKEITDRDFKNPAESVQKLKADAGSLIVDDILEVSVTHHIHSLVEPVFRVPLFF
jgi:hypothetical protein